MTDGRMISRRNFLRLAGGAAGAASVGFLTASCGGETATIPGPDEETIEQQQEAGSKQEEEIRGNQQQAGSEADLGRLLARPGPPRSDSTPSTGLQSLNLGYERDGILYVPEGYRAAEEAPLALVLHGSMSNARRGISPFLDPADEAGLVLLAPDSRDRRDWDHFFLGNYGPDVAFIDQALEQTFDRLAVDAQRLAVVGFSDGASYALSLGLVNGDLFTHVIAFAPGLMFPATYRGEPSIFVLHGAHDEVLRPGRTSRRIVPRLKGMGYEVRFREFEGGHVVPPEGARAAVDWIVGGQG